MISCRFEILKRDEKGKTVIWNSSSKETNNNKNSESLMFLVFSLNFRIDVKDQSRQNEEQLSNIKFNVCWKMFRSG